MEEEIKKEIAKLEDKLEIKISFDESEIGLVDRLLVRKLLEGSVTREMINEELYLPIIIFISEVYRMTHGGELVNGEENRLNPSSFKYANGRETLNYLAVYMDFQQSSSFLTEAGYLDFVYAELVADCSD